MKNNTEKLYVEYTPQTLSMRIDEKKCKLVVGSSTFMSKQICAGCWANTIRIVG